MSSPSLVDLRLECGSKASTVSFNLGRPAYFRAGARLYDADLPDLLDALHLAGMLIESLGIDQVEVPPTCSLMGAGICTEVARERLTPADMELALANHARVGQHNLHVHLGAHRQYEDQAASKTPMEMFNWAAGAVREIVGDIKRVRGTARLFPFRRHGEQCLVMCFTDDTGGLYAFRFATGQRQQHGQAEVLVADIGEALSMCALVMAAFDFSKVVIGIRHLELNEQVLAELPAPGKRCSLMAVADHQGQRTVVEKGAAIRHDVVLSRGLLTARLIF